MAESRLMLDRPAVALRALLLAAASLLALACRDRLAQARAELNAQPLTIAPPTPPKALAPEPLFGDPWRDGQVLRKVLLPNLPYIAEFVGAECVTHPEEHALLLVRLLKADGEALLQELSHYGVADEATEGTFASPSLEKYPNFSHVTTEVRDLNFDGHPDILIGDAYAPERGVHGYAVWMFDARNGSFTNTILPRVGKVELDAEHREVASKSWNRGGSTEEAVYSFARSPFVAERLTID